MLKKITCTFTLIFSLSPIMAEVKLKQVESLYQKAMQNAGGDRSSYSVAEIRSFNKTFLPLIGKDEFPKNIELMIPGTKPRFMVNFLNKLIEGSEGEDLNASQEAQIECAKKEGLMVDLAPMPESQVMPLEEIAELSDQNESAIISEQENPLQLSSTEVVLDRENRESNELAFNLDAPSVPRFPRDPMKSTAPGSSSVAHLGQYEKILLSQRSTPKRISEDFEFLVSETDPNYILGIKDSSSTLPFLNKYIECDDCPSYVASLTLREPGIVHAQQCSGSIVEYAGKTYLYTNRHCIPEDMKEDFKAGRDIKNCGARITATFPENKKRGLKREIASCKKVVAISEEPMSLQGPPDWAIIELDSVDRKPAKMQTRITLPGEEITIHPMYPRDKEAGEHSNITREDSAGLDRDFQLVTSKKVECTQDRTTGFINSKDCTAEMTQGNSGSGTFNGDHFTGVFSHLYPDKDSVERSIGSTTDNGIVWANKFEGTRSHDILLDIYLKQKADPSYRVYPMEELDALFPELKHVKVPSKK